MDPGEITVIKTYSIANWNRSFENNRTRELMKLEWVPIQNKHDSDGYTQILNHPKGPAIYGAWIACVQVASKCENRGILVRNGGKPHDAESLSRMTRFPARIIQQMLEFLSSSDIGWLEINELDENCENPAGGCENPAGGCENPASGCLEGKGIEGKGIEGKPGSSSKSASGKFSKPTESEVIEYCLSLDLPKNDGVVFWNSKEGNGWKNRQSSVKDWKATIRAWKAKGYMASQKAATEDAPKPKNMI